MDYYIKGLSNKKKSEAALKVKESKYFECRNVVNVMYWRGLEKSVFGV